jgi:hypothetical protein
MLENTTQLEPGTPSTTSSEQGEASQTERSKLQLPDLGEAQRFLTALARTESVTFQTLPERKHPKSGRPMGLNRLLHGRFANQSEALNYLNRNGAGIFFMVNQSHGTGRKTEDVARVRALFVDLDGSDLQPVLKATIPPSITVESSPGRYHAYWLIGGMPLKDFKPAQQALADMFGGDKTVCDLPRLMRLPGFYHQKSSFPFRSKLLSCEPELVWKWEDLANGLCLPFSSIASTIPKGERNSTLFRLAASSALQGTSREQKAIDLHRINQERCSPPLPDHEVDSIVESAYRVSPSIAMKVPLDLLRDETFVKLGVGPKCLMLLIHQKFTCRTQDSDFPVLWKDFKQHFPRENTFKKYRQVLARTGLLIQTRWARKPKDGVSRWNLYRIRFNTGM